MVRRVGLAVCLCATALFFSGCSMLPGSGPSRITPPDNAKLAFTLKGHGLQSFQCISDKSGRYWRFIAPKASLVDEQGSQQVTQGGDFSFLASDGSRLTAKISDWAPAANSEDLKSVLFATRSFGKRQGRLTGIRWVERSEASGGMPLTACSPSQLGMLLNVRFSATYRFYR